MPCSTSSLLVENMGLRGFGRANMSYSRVLIPTDPFNLGYKSFQGTWAVLCLLVKHIHGLQRYPRSQGTKSQHVRTHGTTLLPVRSWLGEGLRQKDNENWASLLNTLKWASNKISKEQGPTPSRVTLTVTTIFFSITPQSVSFFLYHSNYPFQNIFFLN